MSTCCPIGVVSSFPGATSLLNCVCSSGYYSPCKPKTIQGDVFHTHSEVSDYCTVTEKELKCVKCTEGK